jgi:hypothetical protein
VLALVTAWNHDSVICIAGNPAGVTVVTTPINISVPTLIVRGPGRAFRFVPAASGSPTVQITADHVALSEVDIYTAGGGSDDGLLISGANDVRVDTVHVWNPTANGVKVQNSIDTKIVGLLVNGAGADGVYLGAGVQRLELDAPDVSGCTGSGINLFGAAVETNISGKCRFMNCGGYAITISAGAVRTTIGGLVTSINNTFGDVADLGTDTFYTGTFIGGTIKDDVEFTRAIQEGRWKIVGTQMRFYKTDNVTLIAKFDLKNQGGTPVDVSKILVHDRVYVP